MSPMGINPAHSLMLIVGVLVGLLPLGLLDSSLAVTNDFRAAQAAFERKDYDTAVRLLNTLLAAQPDHAAAYALRALAHGYLGRPEEALADHDHLVQAGKEKGDVLRRICIGLLTHLLVQGQEIVRGAAATALAELGPTDTLAALNLALHDSSPRVRTFAIQTAGRFGLAAKLPVVRDAVTDPDVTVRIAALSTLGLSMDPSVAGLVRHGLKDQDSIVQLVAREALVRLNQPELVQPFLTAARDFSPAVRGAAMGILGRLKVKDPTALSALTLGLSDPDASVRSFAAGALGDLGATSAITALVDALSDRDPYVRNFAADSLGRLNAKAAIGALWGAVKDSDSLVRLAAAEALVKLGEGEAALVMRELLKDPDFGVRSAAVGAMARSAPERAMTFALESFDDPAPRVRVAAVQALGRVGGKTAIPYLRRALLDKDLTVRAFAAGHLGAAVSDRKRKGES